MKNTGYILAGAGLIGSMCGASALDGPNMAAGIVVTLAGLAALRIGDLLIKMQRKEVMQHEQPRKLVLREKRILSAIGLKPENWAVYKEDSDYLYVVHKISGRKRKIIKNAPGQESRKGHKNK